MEKCSILPHDKTSKTISKTKHGQNKAKFIHGQLFCFLAQPLCIRLNV